MNLDQPRSKMSEKMQASSAQLESQLKHFGLRVTQQTRRTYDLIFLKNGHEKWNVANVARRAV